MFSPDDGLDSDLNSVHMESSKKCGAAHSHQTWDGDDIKNQMVSKDVSTLGGLDGASKSSISMEILKRGGGTDETVSL